MTSLHILKKNLVAGINVDFFFFFILDDLVQFLQGAEQVAGVGVLVGVADELGVELLVAVQGDAALLLVVLVHQLVEGLVELADGLVGHPVHAVDPELVNADVAVT